MKFSIIMPAHNAEKEIDDAIKSVLEQKFNDYEFIVINDYSTDNTEQVVKKYENVKLINHKKNKKAGGARNTGIDEAKGEYIFFLDSDDKMYDENVLQKLSDNIEANNNPDVVYLGFKAEGNSFNGIYMPDKNNSSKYNRIKDWKFANVWDVCWKKSFILDNKIRFVEEKFFEDFLFYYKAILASTSYSYTDFISIIYNSGREESMTTFINPQKIKDFYFHLELFMNLYESVDEEYKPLFKDILIKQNDYMNRLVKRLK